MTDKWLITGATGLLGANACRVLSRHFEITAVTRQSLKLPSAQHTLHVDLLDSQATQQAIVSAEPSVILHAAALASHEDCERNPELAYRMNVEATAHVTQVAREVGAALVHISTDAVFDGKEGNYTEDSPTNPFSVYGKTKLQAEDVALEYDQALVVRTNFFGWSPSGTRSILEFFVRNLREGRPVRGFTDFIVSSIYVTDLIETLPLLATTQHRGILHVASPDALSKFQFGQAVAQEFGLDADLITPSLAADSSGASRGGRDLSLKVDLVQSLLLRHLSSQRQGIRNSVREEGVPTFP